MKNIKEYKLTDIDIITIKELDPDKKYIVTIDIDKMDKNKDQLKTFLQSVKSTFEDYTNVKIVYTPASLIKSIEIEENN